MRDARRNHARRVVLLAALGLAAFGGACSENSGTPPNLLLITIDTARADRLGCYGASAAGTPNLDRIAEEGALFEKAISTATATLPYHI